MDHSEEAVGQLIVASSDGPVDLELPEHALDAIALLVERPIMFDFHAAVDRPGMTASIFRLARSARSR